MIRAPKDSATISKVTLMLKNVTSLEFEPYIKDDPIRPHLSIEFRTINGREIYALENFADGRVQSVLCMAYSTRIPINEQELSLYSSPSGEMAIFYTIWSYLKGAGREIIIKTKDRIECSRPWVNRFVTMSPKTQMAHEFHIKNGAILFSENELTNNYEYEPTPWRMLY